MKMILIYLERIHNFNIKKFLFLKFDVERIVSEKNYINQLYNKIDAESSLLQIIMISGARIMRFTTRLPILTIFLYPISSN